MHVGAVIVTWNVSGCLDRCLESLARAAGETPRLTLETWVVDNASTDATAACPMLRGDGTHLIRNTTNAGFAAAVNQGLRAVGERADAVLLLNPDAELLPGALAALVGHLHANAKAAAVGPRLLNPDGSVQPSRRRFPTPATAIFESTVLQQWLPIRRILDAYYVAERPDDLTQEVDWLVGACLLVRTEALREVGPLDERFFMYFEETDWCLRARARGWRIHYVAEAAVGHQGGHSSRQDVAARHARFTASKCRYFAKHFGGIWGLALRAVLVLDIALRIIEDAVKLAFGHRAAMRRSRIAAMGAALRATLRA